MPATFHIDEENRLVRSYAWGDVSFVDIAQHRKALRDDPNFDDTYNQLCIWTGVTSVTINSAEVRILTNERLFAPSARRAFAVPEGLVFGMMRMFQAYGEISGTASESMIFTGDSEAPAWLNRHIAA